MKTFFAIYFVIVMIFIIMYECEAKGGRGGGYSRGSSHQSSSSSHSSPSYSYSNSHSYSQPSPSYSSSNSYSRPSYSHSRPSPSYSHSRPSPSYSHSRPSPSNSHSRPASAPSYGWNTKSSSGSHSSGSSNSGGSRVGWNENTGRKIDSKAIGWNVQKPSPFGPPPAYPGLNNQKVPSNNQPPAYSPSYNNPPSYSQQPNVYENTFGSAGLPKNSYISNNYYDNRRSSSDMGGFLTNALFYGAGMQHGHKQGNRKSHRYHYGRRSTWDEKEDRRWRATTKAPYFENKVPGEEKILPASAVVDAATAFGLVSLLPLNVPPLNPLMYCKNTDLAQSPIRINNGYVYYCFNNTIEILCPPEMLKNVNENLNIVETSTVAENSSINDSTTVTEDSIVETSTATEDVNSIVETSSPRSSEICEKRTMLCDTNDNIFCINGVLLSRNFIFCNSTTLLNGTNENETTTLLNCYEGKISPQKASFIPTTTTTEAPETHNYIFIKEDNILRYIKINPTTTPAPIFEWIPEALTEAPFDWMKKVSIQHENGTFGVALEPVSQQSIDIYKRINNFQANSGYKETNMVSPMWVKVYRTESPTATSSTEVPTTTTTTEAPYDWMIKRSTQYENGSFGDYLYPVANKLVDGVIMANKLRVGIGEIQTTTMPSSWIKVYRTESTATSLTDHQRMTKFLKKVGEKNRFSTFTKIPSTSTKTTTEVPYIDRVEMANKLCEGIGEIQITAPSSWNKESGTEAPYDWMMKVPTNFSNGTLCSILKPVEKELVDAAESANRALGSETIAMPLSWIKVYRKNLTTQSSTEEALSIEDNSEEESSFIANILEKLREIVYAK